MNQNKSENKIQIFTGSTFEGCIEIKDVHGNPYCISEGDTITLFLKKNVYPSTNEIIQIELTSENEIMGKYPFKLSAEETANIEGYYCYYAFIRFADGDYYQIVPNTSIKVCVPYGVLSYSADSNTIIAQVPRVMAESDYIPSLNELESFIKCIDSENTKHPVQIRRINDKYIVLIGNIDTNNTTPTELIEQIIHMAEYVGAENPYVSGFFHIDELPEQTAYYEAVKNTFGKRFIDIEAILKTPVYARNSETIVSSVVFDLLKQRPTKNDILCIIHNEYPERIMSNNTHFNNFGCSAAARVILKEVFDLG